MRTVCIMFLFALMLQGCGKKGPLFVPKPEQSASQSAPQPQSQSLPLPQSQPQAASQPN